MLQSPDFPLSVDMLLNVLEVITPFKHFNKLREFVQMKLPPGFPVKIGKDSNTHTFDLCFSCNIFDFKDLYIFVVWQSD